MPLAKHPHPIVDASSVPSLAPVTNNWATLSVFTRARRRTPRRYRLPINYLRRILFETIEGVLDEKNPLPIEKAEVVGKLSQVVVNTGRLECDYLEILSGLGTGFVTEDEVDPDADHNQPALTADKLRLIARGRSLK